MIKLIFDHDSMSQLTVTHLKLFHTQCDLINKINSIIPGQSQATGNVGSHIDNILYQKYGWKYGTGWSNDTSS